MEDVSIWRNWQGNNNNKNPPRLKTQCFWFSPELCEQNNRFSAWKGIVIGLYSGSTKNEYASEKANMAPLNNFLQEPAFECIFHPAWGKQFVPVSSSGSYRGVMQFIFVSKFSELCRTKETFTRIVPPVIWCNGQCCCLFSPVPWGWRVEVFVKYWDQKSFLKLCLSSLCLSLWFRCACLHSSASCWPRGAWLLLWWGAFCKCNFTPFPLRLPCVPNCLH